MINLLIDVSSGHGFREGALTIQTLAAAMALAVYRPTVTERRSKACAMELKPWLQLRHSVAVTSLLPLLLLQRWRQSVRTKISCLHDGLRYTVLAGSCSKSVAPVFYTEVEC